MSDIEKQMKEITEALNRLEEAIRESGYRGPEVHPQTILEDRIRLPQGFIRTVTHFENAYSLGQFIDDADVRKNIAYALQYSDFTNYLLGRFNLYLSVGALSMKYAILNVFCIIEAILYCCVNTLHDECIAKAGACMRREGCRRYFRRADKYTFASLVDAVDAKLGLCFSVQQRDQLGTLKGLRDNVHVWDTSSNEFTGGGYDIEYYNSAVRLLHTLRDELPDLISAYRSSRDSAGCLTDE